MSKANLRKLLLARRRAINPVERQQAALQAVEIFATSALYQSSQHIACYYPFADEFDCLPLIQKIWRDKKNCYLPTLSTLAKGFLDFVAYESEDALQVKQYGILEPIVMRKIELQKLDVILFPLVGFDGRGNRLGMGGGYYDRTFGSMCTVRAKKLGLGYACQYLTAVPHEPWDVSLDGILTEKNLFFF